MKIKSISFLIFVLGSSVRCSDIDYKNRTDEKQIVSLSSDESFEVKLRGLSEPNKFKAVVQYSGPNPGNWTVLKKSNDLKLTSFDLSNERSGPFEDLDIQSGESYKYLIGKNHEGSFQIAKEIEVTPPEDLVIQGTVNLQNLEIMKTKSPIFRIFFLKDSILKTNGEDVHLEVEEIFSENGTFQTFSSSDQAAIGVDGAHSGKVHLKAERIDGQFTIEIRGQKGGEGIKGATGPQGSRGQDIMKLISGYGWDVGPVCKREVYDRFVAHGYPMNCGSYEQCRILLHPGVGGKGGTGGIGFPGYVGHKGGDAQTATLEIPVSENTQFIFEPGAGGPGGQGGDPGPGGLGGTGAGFNDDTLVRCDPSPQGATGDEGPPGPRGPDGLSGNKETLTINGVMQ